MNLKKLIIPLSLGAATLGGYSLMTEPKIEPQIQKPQTELSTDEKIKQIVEMIQPKEEAKEEEKPLMSHEAALALTALGLGGIAAFGGKKIYDEFGEIQTTEIKENGNVKVYRKYGSELKLDRKIKENLIMVIEDNNKKFLLGDGYGLTELKKNISKKKSEDYNELAIKEALAIIDNLKNLFLNGMKDAKQRQKTTNRELPHLIYLVDKITSSPAEWDNNKRKYDVNSESFKKYNEEVNMRARECSKAKKEGRIGSFQQRMEEIKEMLLQYGTADSSAFADMLECVYYFTSKQAVKDFSENPNGGNFDKMRKQYNNSINLHFGTKQESNVKQENTNTQSTSRRRVDKQETGNNKNVGMTKEINKDINPKITFASVGGQDGAIDKLKKNVMFPLKYPEAFKNRMLNRGIILYGPPGTGKTLMALALANESDANFIKINASEMTSKWHGESEKNWRDIFSRARKSQPCIIFIDEFDTVAQKRGHNASNNYDDTVANQILAEMSDLEKNGDNVFLIGATNRFDELDSGITRAGRFGTHIEITAPKTIQDVIKIFDIHIKDKPLADDVDKKSAAKIMLDMNVTGADIAAIVNNALENSYNRLGIYEKMENGTFTNDDLKEVKIKNCDLVSAICNYKQ